MNAPDTAEQLWQIAHQRVRLGQSIVQSLAQAGPQSCTQLMRQKASAWPEAIALVHRERSMSYAQMFERMDRARQALHDRGVRAGQSVALLMNNSDQYVLWYFAVLGLGAVAVPLNNRLVPTEAAYILRHSQAVLLITEPTYAETVDALAKNHDMAIATVTLSPDSIECELAATAMSAEPPLQADAPAALYYTSGTTGQPKGVVHTHASLNADSLQSPSAWEYDFAGVRSLAITPLFHIAAHTIFFPVLFEGGTLVIDTYETQATLALLERQSINAFFAVPSILLLMVDKAGSLGITLPGVRTVMFGAAPMTISRLDDVQRLFPNAALVHGMGQTESGGTLVTLPSVAAKARAGSVGLAMAGVEVAIVDEQDRRVPAGQVGELVARGPNLMRGYLHNETATQETLRHGWLHTGDLGFQDEEGLVTLVDRKKDMIIRGGENIYSCEVEQVLMRHPAIQGAAVVGQRDAIFGEQVAAFLVANPALPRPDEAALREHCRQALADFKIPVTLRFIEGMPLTATGKVRKTELRDSLPAYERRS